MDLTGDATAGGNRGEQAAAREAHLAAVESGIGVSNLDEYEQAEPPRKRPKTQINASSVGPSGGHEAEEDDAQKLMPGESLGLPPRRMHSSRAPVRPRLGGENGARKADGLNPPALATRMAPPKKAADFSPWNGCHPEDALNEQVVKAGYSDKAPPPNQNESNSARHSIWPNLSQKNHLALQTLSHLYTQVLEKRQALGRCSAPSSFKPPPRVTVTDTKREAWLRDLANPSVPLRRQSRTIPHGIRGKLLLEQCLAKAIPLQRAVWLTKCVGANELRAFRRKGVSGSAAAQGETKWIRDWTVSVEQFLDDTIQTPAQVEWRRKIEYAIKVTATLYTEGLLDKAHFLDWIVSSFTGSTSDRVPLWILIIQIYWRELVAFGRRGRKLAQAVLEHLRIFQERGHSIYDPVKLRLQRLLAAFSSQARECLIIPPTWDRYKHLHLSHEEDSTARRVDSAATNIRERNERLVLQWTSTLKNTRHPLVELYAKLDAVDLRVNVTELAGECLSTISEHTKLVPALLRWAGTRNRSGTARIYLAARLIAHLHRTGVDTDDATLAFLAAADSAAAVESESIFAVMVEQVRQGCFSVGRYMQWLIASGAISSPETSKLATGLLDALPINALPQHLQNTRLSLLRRLGHSTGDCAAVDTLIAEVDRALQHNSFNIAKDTLTPHLQGSSKLALNAWIRSKILDMAKNSGINLRAFCVFRRILEQTGGIDVLQVLIDASVQTEDFVLLASVTDTVNAHALTLAIISHLPSVIDGVVERYRALRTQQPLERNFICALQDLTARLPDRVAVVKLLTNDLTVHEQQSLNAVCSPASDSLIGMHAGSLESDQEIDSVFASGNSMDEQLMQRVFMRVMQRADRPSEQPVVEASSNTCRWLNQLRTLDTIAFEDLARNYFTNAVKGSPDGGVSEGAYALIAGNCLGLEVLASAMKEITTANGAAAALRFLSAPLADHSPLSVSERYHLRQRQAQFCRARPMDLCRVVSKYLEGPPTIIEAEKMTETMSNLLLGSPEALAGIYEANSGNKTVLENAKRLFEALLKRVKVAAMNSPSLTPHIVAQAADTLSAPLCAGWLRLYSATDAAGVPDRDGQLEDALTDAISRDSPVWPQLLAAARSGTVRAIHEWALERLLSIESAGEDDMTEDALSRYHLVLDVTYAAANQDEDAQILTTVVDRLKSWEKSLNESREATTGHHQSVGTATRSLEVLLHVAALHSQSVAANDAGRQSRVNLTATLCAVMVNPLLQLCDGLLEHTYDIASAFVDRLPEEAVASVAKGLHSAGSKDRRLVSLLGNTSSPDTWLALATNSSTAGPAHQRVLSRHPSQVGPRACSTSSTAPSPAQAQQQPQQQQQARHMVLQQKLAQQQALELKYSPYVLRRWEIMQDPTPVVGENDGAISLALFGARKV